MFELVFLSCGPALPVGMEAVRIEGLRILCAPKPETLDPKSPILSPPCGTRGFELRCYLVSRSMVASKDNPKKPSRGRFGMHRSSRPERKTPLKSLQTLPGSLFTYSLLITPQLVV